MRLDILQYNWEPHLTIRDILEDIVSLIENPDLNNPLRFDIAKLYKEDKFMNDLMVNKWTADYANGKLNDYNLYEINKESYEMIDEILKLKYGNGLAQIFVIIIIDIMDGISNIYNIKEKVKEFEQRSQIRLKKEKERINDIKKLAAQSPKDKYVIVKMLTDKNLYINCYLNDTISTLKERIEAVEGIPTRHMRLVFNGKQLENNRTLSDYNINYNDIMHLLRRLN